MAPNLCELTAEGAAIYSALSTGLLKDRERFPWHDIEVKRSTKKKALPYNIGISAAYNGQDVYWPIFQSGINYPSEKLELTLTFLGDGLKNQTLTLLKAPGKQPNESFTALPRKEWRKSGIFEFHVGTFMDILPEKDHIKDYTFRFQINENGKLVVQLKGSDLHRDQELSTKL